jgi:hypothetical protein
MTQCILDDTTATDIFLKPRLIFDCTDEVLQRVFRKTDDGTTLPPAYLPSQHILVEWANRLKQRSPTLRTFNLDIKCNTFDIDGVPDDQLLQFEYRAAEAYTEDPEWSNIREDNDLGNPSEQEQSRQYRYTVYPDAIPRCYGRLVKEAEAEALELANAQAEAAIVFEDSWLV